MFVKCQSLTPQKLSGICKGTGKVDFSQEVPSIDYISVVGGLADSTYVLNKIQAKIDELRKKYNIQGSFTNVVNNERSLAIVKGGQSFIV